MVWSREKSRASIGIRTRDPPARSIVAIIWPSLHNKSHKIVSLKKFKIYQSFVFRRQTFEQNMHSSRAGGYKSLHWELRTSYLIVCHQFWIWISRYSDQATGWTIRGLNRSRDKILFSPKRLDRLRGPSSLLFSGDRFSFPGGKAAGA